MTKSTAPPHPHPADHLLAQVCRLHHARAHTLFEAIGVYRGQPPVLVALREQDGLTHSELAARLHVTPATMTRMVQRMERAGHLARRPDPDDQRVSRVYLTPAGRAAQSRLARVFQTMQDESFAGFNAQEIADLSGYLARVRDNLIRAAGEPADGG
jgi:DNA-binding MarR family transcriptional regulator